LIVVVGMIKLQKQPDLTRAVLGTSEFVLYAKVYTRVLDTYWQMMTCHPASVCSPRSKTPSPIFRPGAGRFGSSILFVLAKEKDRLNLSTIVS
jgi:hypothetical protein